MITPENIRVKLGDLQLTKVHGLKITAQINDHARIYLSGVIEAEDRDRYLEKVDSSTTIEVEANLPEQAGSPYPLFKGIITGMEIKMVREIYYLVVEGASFTYQMDVELKKKSFQDINMRYRDLIAQIAESYSNADFIFDQAYEKRLTARVFLQYQETDWNFIKRVVSIFNLGIIPDLTVTAPKFWIGLPNRNDLGELAQFHYRVRKPMGDYRKAVDYIKDLSEDDAIAYEVESDRPLRLGDPVTFQGCRWIISQYTATLQEGILRFVYTLSTLAGTRQRQTFNGKIHGLTLEGRVIQVQDDTLRVHLDIDDHQDPETAHWFTYTTLYTSEGHTGWYCMPELGDAVRLYFPTINEDDGVIVDSVRRGERESERIQKPEVKYFRTIHEKEMRFDEQQIQIAGRGSSLMVRLNQEKGVEIYSGWDMHITAEENLNIDSDKKISVSVGNEIEMTCKDSHTLMNEEVVMTAKRIKKS
jgi:hypothetical protein